jgi:hypothetical protein
MGINALVVVCVTVTATFVVEPGIGVQIRARICIKTPVDLHLGNRVEGAGARHEVASQN